MRSAGRRALREAFIDHASGTDSLTRFGRFLAGEVFRKPGVKRAALAVACGAFLIGIILSIRAQPDLLEQLHWWPLLVLTFMAIPATLLLNAFEFMLSARLVNQASTLGRALEVTVIGSAANLLPLPGAAMVRIAALKSGGASLAHSFSMNGLLAFLWLGIALAYAAAWGAYAVGGPLPIMACAIGLVVLVCATVVCLRVFGKLRVILGLILIRLGLVIVDGSRVYFAFAALGAPATFAQSSILTVAGVLASIVAIVPAGLGLREGIAALIAPLVGLRSGPAFLATSLSRIVGLSAVMILTAALTLQRKAPTAT